jgi:hypothetical protein
VLTLSFDSAVIAAISGRLDSIDFEFHGIILQFLVHRLNISQLHFTDSSFFRNIRYFLKENKIGLRSYSLALLTVSCAENTRSAS